MKNFYKSLLLISAVTTVSNAYALGYVSRDCPSAGAMESFTMSWTSSQWKITRAYLPRIDSRAVNGYTWQRFDSAKNPSYGDWDYNQRSAAGIHPWPISNASTAPYLRAVYGFHYWYNESTHKVEQRSRMVQNSCNVLNWGINNW